MRTTRWNRIAFYVAWGIALGSVAAGAGALVGCRPKPPVPVLRHADGSVVARPDAPSPADESAAAAWRQKADQLAEAGETEAAEAEYARLVETYPGSEAAAHVLVMWAQRAADAGQAEIAIVYYEKVLFYRPTLPEGNRIREHYAELLRLAGRERDAADMLEALYRNAIDPVSQARLGLQWATVLRAQGASLEALEVLVDIAQLPGWDAQGRDAAWTQAQDIIKFGLTFAQTRALWDDVGSDDAWEPLQPLLAFRLAKVHYHTRDFESAEDLLRLILDRYALSDFGPQAEQLLERLRARFSVVPNKIGVLLPLSGRFRQYGERSLAAIRMVFHEDTRFELVVRDSHQDPTTAARELEALALEDGVIAVIGPMFSNESQAAALKAEELGLPILALSHRNGLPEIGPYVFRTALTVRAQAEALAKVAFESLGFRRFAILYPRGRYGTTFTEAFWDAVHKRGGEIRGVEAYEHDATTFRTEVRQLVGRHHLQARPEFVEGMKAIQEEDLPPHRARAKIKRLVRKLPPVVDFDAIVIPDSGRQIGLIAPALAFEDVVLTRDPQAVERIKKATGRDTVSPITLLGASTWNSPQTPRSCERYCEGAVFVDAFFPDSPSPRMRDFASGFQELTGVAPRLSEAQAYDTAGLLRTYLNRSRPKTRKALQEVLARGAPFRGVTGRSRFAPHGELNKVLYTLTIKDGTIRRWRKSQAMLGQGKGQTGGFDDDSDDQGSDEDSDAGFDDEAGDSFGDEAGDY